MNKFLLFSSLSLGMLAGCASTSRTPDSIDPFPKQFTESSKEKATIPESVGQHVQADWWKLFNDSALNRLVEQALIHNSDLKAAAARIEYAKAALKEVNGALLPTIGLQTASTRNRVSQVDSTPLPAGVPTLRTTNTLALATSFEVDVFGKLHTASGIAETELLATQYAKDTIQLSLVSQLVQQYINLRVSESRMDLLQHTRNNQSKRLQIIQQRITGGLSSSLDLRLTESDLATLDANLSTERQAYAIMQHQLALLIGVSDAQIPAGLLANLPVPSTPSTGLPSELLTSRPDLQQAEAILRSAQGRVSLAKKAYFPSINLIGNLGTESQSLSNLFSASASIWSIGLNTALTIFDAGRHAAQEDQAFFKQKEVLANYVKAVQTAFAEVDDALSSLRESRLYAAAQTQRLKATEQSYALVRIRYRSGYVGFIDTLDSQQRVLDAKQSDLLAKQRLLTATVALFKSLGGGWESKSK